MNINAEPDLENTSSKPSSPEPTPGDFKPPTVMQILPELITGGVERGTVDVAGAVVEGGGRSIVVSAGGPMEHELDRLGSEHITLPVDSKNPWIIRQNISRLADLARQEKVDIIHARSRAPAWSAWYAARQTGICFITTFHGTYGHSNWAKRWYNAIMTKGDRVIAISDFIAGHVKKVYGVPAPNIRVIPRGIDIERFDPANVSTERVVRLAKEWRLPDGVPVIMLPGRLTRWKGQTVFIDAVKKLNRDNIQCLVVGSDQGRENYRQELEQEIERFGMTDLIHVIDHCDDMPAALMLTDIVVSASTEPEAFGRVAAEAQALGRQVIATDHGGAKETVIEGETGWLTPPGDAAALATAIAEAIDQSDSQRAKFAERAMAHIRQTYSKEVMCAKTLDVYNEVIAQEYSMKR